MMHPPLKLSERPQGTDRCTLGVQGELDIATAPQFRTEVGALMGSGVRHLEVDLRETSFLDSCGLGALVWAAHRVKAAGGSLCVVNPVPRVSKIMELAGVEQLLCA